MWEHWCTTLCGPHCHWDWFALSAVVQSVLFTRDSGSGRVRIDSEGRPVVSYWPCQATSKHLTEVRRTWCKQPVG
jgi:hypothetical protein